MSKSREQIIDYLNKISIQDKRVLDMGSGDTDNHARNWTRGEPYEYVTSDVNTEFGTDFVMDLNRKHPTVFFKRIGEFDIVFCMETLEHVYDPVQAVENLSKFVKSEGTLYLSTPFINPIHDYWDYLRFTFQWFEKVLPMRGFKDVEVVQRVATFRKELKDFYDKEGMRMSRVTLEQGYGEHFYDVGYIVRAKKE